MQVAAGSRGSLRGLNPPATVASAKVLRHRTAKTPGRGIERSHAQALHPKVPAPWVRYCCRCGLLVCWI